MPYYSRRRTYRRRTTRRSTMRNGMRKRTRRTTRRTRTTYRRRGKTDSGTYLKISSSALPVLLENKATPDTNFQLTADTLQGNLSFLMGNTQGGESIIINNQIDPTNGEFTLNPIWVGSTSLLEKYRALYKYVQIYKIVVKFTPSITEGGVIAPEPGVYFPNAISGMVTTDFDSKDPTHPYPTDYPASVDGQAKSNSRKVSREHKLTKGWTRTFVPKKAIQPNQNPKSKWQYKPDVDITSNESISDLQIPMSASDMVIRMRKPQLAGFTADSIEATEVDYPESGKFVRYGTIMVHAYIKFSSPLF